MLSMRFAEYRRFGVTALMAGLVAVAGCDDDPLDPNDPSNFGEVGVTVNTTGYAPDFAAGYQVGLEGGGLVAVDVTDDVVLVGAPSGSNAIVLEGVPEYCTVTPANPTVNVSVGERAEVDFAIACEAVTGGITPALTVTGAAEDIDQEVTLSIVTVIDPETSDTTDFLVNPSAPEELLHFLAGPRTVVFDSTSLAANCTVADPVEVALEVTLGTTVNAPFTIDCVPNVGNLTVNVTTTGTNLDDNYTITIGEREPVNVGVNGAAEFNDVRVGPQTVALGDIAENCTVTGEQAPGVGAAQTATIVFGAEEMATLDFAVVCEAPPAP